MPDERKLFAVTEWVLRAGIVVTMVLVGLIVLGMAAMIFGLATSRLPLGWIAYATGVTMTADEIARIAHTGAIAALVLALLILRALRRVVASARAGDPFVEANALDLVRVAWLLLGLEVIETLLKPMVYLIAPEAVRMRMHGTFHTPITGLFAVLLIFVLAQIFRRGSEMRAELAGTI